MARNNNAGIESLTNTLLKGGDRRRRSAAKTKGQSGSKYVYNPDKIVNKKTGLTKEQYVRSGARKRSRGAKTAELGGFLGGAALMFKDDIKRTIDKFR
tara:strand:+ start:684 stop:977 length:294 start_codon:yes stop_codon:yes gene_type:complete